MLKTSNIKKSNLLGIGTGRIVFDNCDGTVLKLPYNLLGCLANKIEYKNSQNLQVVAKTEFVCNVLIQEKLVKTIFIPYKQTLNANLLKKQLQQIDAEYDWNNLISKRINNSFQVGKNQNGEYKFYDYESIKFLHPEYEKAEYVLQKQHVQKFINYVKKTGLQNICESNLFVKY
ncbi:MAG: hypothetical protein RR140_04035 [Clostridia bacterium]